MKDILRNHYKEKRLKLECEILSEKIRKNLISLPEYKCASDIVNYYFIGSEVKTTDLFADKTKNWYLPRVNGEELEICPYIPERLKENKYKILEPENEKISDLYKIDMVIIPCICADKNGYRLGYGKGYYDRFLKPLPDYVKKVVLAYSQLIVDDIEPEAHDVQCDIIVTDEEIYRI